MSEVGTSEHRFLTIEFIDLVGYTDLAERLDPEELGVLLRRYQRLALTTMERFGGFVAQAFGDGLLVYFGYPAAHGNECVVATHARVESAVRDLPHGVERLRLFRILNLEVENQRPGERPTQPVR